MCTYNVQKNGVCLSVRFASALKKVLPGATPTKNPDPKKMKLEEFRQELHKYALRFKDEDDKEWKEFLQEFENRVESIHCTEPWSFQALLPINQQRPTQPTPHTQQEKEITKELDQLILKRAEEILVYLL